MRDNMKVLKPLSLLVMHFALSFGIFGEEVSTIPIALAEGPAEGNAIDAIAQIGKSGLIIITASPNLDLASDIVESSYDPAFHMPEIRLATGPISAVSANLNRVQNIVQFSLVDAVVTALIPRTDATTTRIIALLGSRLKFGAGTTLDLNDDNGLGGLNAAITENAKAIIPAITSITINLWPKIDGYFYLHATNRPHIPTIIVDPDTTFHDIISKTCSSTHGIIWIIQAIGSHLDISLTTVQMARSSRTLAVIVADLKFSNSELGDYPTKESRIRDASREIERRLLMDPATTKDALVSSGAIRELIYNMNKNSDATVDPLYFLLCYRNNDLSDLILSEVNKAPKELFDKFYYSTMPGINGHGPGWKDLYAPVWKQLLGNTDPDIVKRARAMLVEH